VGTGITPAASPVQLSWGGWDSEGSTNCGKSVGPQAGGRFGSDPLVAGVLDGRWAGSGRAADAVFLTPFVRPPYHVRCALLVLAGNKRSPVAYRTSGGPPTYALRVTPPAGAFLPEIKADGTAAIGKARRGARARVAVVGDGRDGSPSLECSLPARLQPCLMAAP